MQFLITAEVPLLDMNYFDSRTMLVRRVFYRIARDTIFLLQITTPTRSLAQQTHG